MTALRQRLIEDMQVRNYSPRTVEAYVAAVASSWGDIQNSFCEKNPECPPASTLFENRRIIAAAERLGLNQAQLDEFVNAHPDYFFIQEKVANLNHSVEIPGIGNLEPILEDMIAFFHL